MKELQEQTERLVETETIQDLSTVEKILGGLLGSYQNAYNKHNQTSILEYWVTVTMHKVQRPEGNKDVAYLRIVRGIKENNDVESPTWDERLVHQEIYVFRSIQEQANPKAPWREQLYLNSIARLVHAGLEYGEILTTMQQQQEEKDRKAKESGLLITDQLPKPLSPDEEQYKEWIKNEKQKEGL